MSATTGPRAASTRVRLALVADEALLSMPAVVPTGGTRGIWATVDGPRRIEGVLSVAAPGDRYDLELHLLVAWPPEPLERLGERVRERVASAVRRAGLESELGDVHVRIEGVIAPDETAPSSASVPPPPGTR